MNQLFRIGLVNWHVLPSMDIEVTGDIGVIGENRSGKSTLLDLIQVVMTGNDGRYLRLNASANDSGRKRGMRSVHAYCLGRLGPDSVTRPESRSTIFLCFRNTYRPREVVTLGLALEASERETAERVQAQFIATGHALSVADLLVAKPDGSQGTRDWGQLRPHLDRLCLEAGGSLTTFRDEPGKYVSEYMKVLSTGRRTVAVDQVMKAFVNAISFEQIPNATEFVRRYLLEKDDIRIRDLRQSIATYHQLQKDTARLREKLDALEEMRAAAGSHKATVASHDRHQWMDARASLDSAVRRTRAVRRSRDTALADIARATREFEEYGRLIRETEEERDGLLSAISRETQSGRMQELAQQKKALELECADTARSLATTHRSITRGLAALQNRPVLDALAPRLAAPLEKLAAVSGDTLPPHWPSAPDALARLLDDPALGALATLPDKVRREADRLVKEQAIPERALADLTGQIADIRDRGVRLDPTVAQFVGELEDLGLRPRVAGPLLRVLDESWRDAAEALLGRDREAVLVDAGQVDTAIRHLQANRRRFRGCRVINTRKIDTSRCDPDSGSLAAVLASDDPAVMAFVIRRIGSVRCAETLEDLHRPGRAVMRDGTYDDGLAVEMRTVFGGHRIGAGAGRSSLPQMEAEARDLAAEVSALEARIAAHRAVAAALEALGAVAGQGETLRQLCGRLESDRARLEQVEADMADLKANLAPDLQSRVDDLKALLTGYHNDRTEAKVALSTAKAAVGEATRTLSAGDHQPGSRLHSLAAFRKWCRIKPLLTAEAGRAVYADARAKGDDDLERIARDARKEADTLRGAVETGRNHVFDLYLAYHALAGTRPDLTRETVSVAGDIAPWADAAIHHIRDTELVDYEAQAADAAEKTRNIFQHSFAYELRQRFAKMDRALAKLNGTLRDHEFHYERYRFTSKPMEPMRDIIALVRASESDDSLFGLLFDQSVGDEHPHARAIETVRALLLDDDVDLAAFEDYRAYFSFNLIMKDSRTGRESDLEMRRGTGSGAEQQVPFYVAIGSALAAAYHDRAAGDPAIAKGLGLAVFDEAFSKLDSKNQRACMDFYEKLGLQIVVAAPFDKRATLYETMDTFVETIRVGDAVDIECTEIRPRTRQAFAAANPAHVSLDDFRHFLESRDQDSHIGTGDPGGP